MRRLCSSAEIARLVDITRQAVSAAARSGPLKEAAVGERIDVSHPAVAEYLRKHGLDEQTIERFVSSIDGRKGPGTEADADDFESYADLTFREVFERFGTLERFSDHLDAYKTYEQVIGQRLKNEELAGKLIEREFVQTYVFGVLEELSQRLLRDHPKTTAIRAFDLFSAGGTVEEAEELIRTDASSHLGPARRRVETSLRKKAAEAALRLRESLQQVSEQSESAGAEPAKERTADYQPKPRSKRKRRS